MFNFLKRHKPQADYEQVLNVRERALNVFSKIEALDDVKEMMLRALESSERAHTLLTGPPASAKSLFMLEIEKFLRHKVYFAEGASTTKTGLQKFIADNQDKEIIKTGSSDIRDVLKIAKLCNPCYGEEDISRLINIHQKYRKTGNYYN
jgi:hypothetical protein